MDNPRWEGRLPDRSDERRVAVDARFRVSMAVHKYEWGLTQETEAAVFELNCIWRDSKGFDLASRNLSAGKLAWYAHRLERVDSWIETYEEKDFPGFGLLIEAVKEAANFSRLSLDDAEALGGDINLTDLTEVTYESIRFERFLDALLGWLPE